MAILKLIESSASNIPAPLVYVTIHCRRDTILSVCIALSYIYKCSICPTPLVSSTPSPSCNGPPLWFSQTYCPTLGSSQISLKIKQKLSLQRDTFDTIHALLFDIPALLSRELLAYRRSCIIGRVNK